MSIVDCYLFKICIYMYLLYNICGWSCPCLLLNSIFTFYCFKYSIFYCETLVTSSGFVHTLFCACLDAFYGGILFYIVSNYHTTYHASASVVLVYINSAMLIYLPFSLEQLTELFLKIHVYTCIYYIDLLLLLLTSGKSIQHK